MTEEGDQENWLIFQPVTCGLTSELNYKLCIYIYKIYIISFCSLFREVKYAVRGNAYMFFVSQKHFIKTVPEVFCFLLAETFYGS